MVNLDQIKECVVKHIWQNRYSCVLEIYTDEKKEKIFTHFKDVKDFGEEKPHESLVLLASISPYNDIQTGLTNPETEETERFNWESLEQREKILNYILETKNKRSLYFALNY